MSDARQAIAVAREAGAADRAPNDLRAAERYLGSAQRNRSERAGDAARGDARRAKLKALDALAAAGDPEQRDRNSPHHRASPFRDIPKTCLRMPPLHGHRPG